VKLLVISAFAAVALLAAATTTLRSRSSSTDGPVGTAGMPSLQELQSATDVNKLPTEDVDGQSLVYSTGTKH
jgi:hypothetical protein